MSTKRERVDLVNEFVKVISNNGRRFFHHNGAVAKIELTKRGHLFWHDEYSKVRIYVGRPGKWCGFNNGGTLRRLVECLAEFVRKEQQISTYQPAVLRKSRITENHIVSIERIHI